jgi:hypothetical protein
MNKQTYTWCGVHIPARVWTNQNIGWLGKIAWAIIAYSHDGSCICKITDAEFADWLGESEMVAAQAILLLEKEGLIHVAVDADGNREMWTSNVEFVDRQVAPEAVPDMADVRRIVEIYNECCKTMPRAEKMTQTRARRIRAIMAEHNEDADDYFRRLFTRAHNSDFLSGRSGQWKAQFDWLLQPANITKLEEGAYDNRKAGPRTTNYRRTYANVHWTLTSTQP